MRAGAALLATPLATACGRDQTGVRAAEIEQGRALYARERVRHLPRCHRSRRRASGKDAEPAAAGFPDAAAFTNGTDPTSVANTIATGLTRDGGQMQSYFHLSDRERLLLARFVISLRESAADGGPQ